VTWRALAHELCGLAQQMLDTAARHVTDRHQFGKPIAAFQTVRHRLTEVHVAIAAARPVLDAAWTTGDPLAADAGKALAGRAGQLAGRHCLQVTGAIGFTWEYELHHQIRRAHLLDGLYGSARAVQAAIGADLLARGGVPRIRPLP
jgi:alkylation response protein AidB-like acyl-CoA dehydrogenase